MKLRLFSVIILLSSTIIIQSCVDKGLRQSSDKLIVGDWQLVEIKDGTETIKEFPTTTLFQFTADRQLVIDMPNRRSSAKYMIENSMIIVEDGLITNIKESINILSLTKKELMLSFKMDGKPVMMKFNRKNE